MNYIYIIIYIYCIILYIYCILQNSLLATSVDIISISSIPSIPSYSLILVSENHLSGVPSEKKILAPSHKSHKSSTDGWFYIFNMFPSNIRNVMFRPGFKVLKEVRDVRDAAAVGFLFFFCRPSWKEGDEYQEIIHE